MIKMQPEPDLLPGRGRILLAFSAGPDSLCLAHLLAAAAPARPMICIHVDHGLDDQSAERADRARALANGLGIECRVVRVKVGNFQGPESAARAARYQALREHMQAGETLLTAHHADDQAETVLLRLLRAAGPDGLSGMPRTRPFAAGWLVRPLLDCKRTDIERYLAAHHLEPLRDPANEQSGFDRNFVRHQVMPLLDRRWAGARRAILRSARLNAGASEALQELAASDLARCMRQPGRLDLAPLARLSDFRRCEVLRRWCHQSGMNAPPGRQLEQFISQLAEAREDRIPELRWNDGIIRRWAETLWLEKRPEPPASWQLQWRADSKLTLPGGLGRLELTGALSDAPGLRVASGQPGERIRLAGREGHRRVKQLLAEHGIPPWQRPLWPRLWRDGILIAVGDRWLDADFKRELEQQGLELIWHTELKDD